MKSKKILYSLLMVSLLIVVGGFINNYISKNPGVVIDESRRGEDGSGKIEEVGAAKKYTNSAYGFSFEYPKEFTVGQFYDGEGESIVLQSASSSSRLGMQVFIAPTDLPVELTPSLIQKELPGTLVKNPQKIELDGKAKGILFESNNPAFDGKSAELWFYYGGNVYQVTSYPEGAGKMTEIMGTWRFK